MRRRFPTALGIAVVLVLIAAVAAIADTIQVDGTKPTTMTVGDTANVNYQVVGGGSNPFCDIGSAPNQDSSVTVTLTVEKQVSGSTYAPANPSTEFQAGPTTLIFTGCNQDQQTVFTAHMVGQYRITASAVGNNGQGTYNPTPAQITLTVSEETPTTVAPTTTTTDPCASVATPAAPVFSYAPDGDNGWYQTIPTVSASSSTAGAIVTYSTTSGSGYNATPPTLTDGQTTVYAIATSATCDKVSSESSQLFKVDTTAPVVSLVDGPDDDASYYYGFVPDVPTCTASDATSGLADYDNDSANGQTDCVVSGYSGAVGTHTVTANARDNAGNTGDDSRSYTVLAWTLYGFYQPVDMSPGAPSTIVWNTVKAGATVPFKFRVFAGPTELTNTGIVNPLWTRQVACVGSIVDDLEVTATGGTSIRYDTTGSQFVYNWQSPKLSGSCYQVTMSTADGSSLSAYFRLK